MWTILRAPIEVVYTLGSAFDGIVYAVYTALILTVGIVVWYGLFCLVRYLLFKDERNGFSVLKQYDGRKKVWIKPKSRSCANVGHVVLLTLFYGGLVIIVWLASVSAGFNPWTSAAASLGLSIIATYALATPLGLMGSGFFVLLTNAISVGQFWEFYGMGEEWEGRIVAINVFSVTMVRVNTQVKDKQTAEIISMPIGNFLSSPCKRVMWKECATEEQCGIKSAESIPTVSGAKQNQTLASNTVVSRKIANRFAESMI